MVVVTAVYKRIEDVAGQCDALFKKATIARLRGDEDLAEDWARRYCELYESHFSALDDEELGTRVSSGSIGDKI